MESNSSTLYSAVCEDVQRHCLAKGCSEGKGCNDFIPHDAIAAFGMAKLLRKFDRYVVVAPGGHIYGYFFERLGISTLSVFTDDPSTGYRSDDDLTVLENQKVLLIIDAATEQTLQLVVDYLSQYKPDFLALYLGNRISSHHFENVPSEIERNRVFSPELMLSPNHWKEMDFTFPEFFKSILESRRTNEQS